MKKIIKRILIIVPCLIVFSIISFFGYSYYKISNSSSELKNLEMTFLASRCNCLDGACSENFDDVDVNADNYELDHTHEPIEMNISYPSKKDYRKVIKLADYSHVHSANKISSGEMVYTAKSNDDKCYIVKEKLDSTFERFEISELPFNVYAYNETVLFIIPSGKNTAKVGKVDFENHKIITIIDDLAFDLSNEWTSDYAPGKLWIKGTKILYKSASKNWMLYDNNNVTTLGSKFDGACVGFNSDNSVVFYEDLNIFIFTRSDIYSWGKFTQYNLDTGSSRVLSRIVSEAANFLKLFNISSDGRYVVMQAASADGPTATRFIDIKKGKTLKLGGALLGYNRTSAFQEITQ